MLPIILLILLWVQSTMSVTLNISAAVQNQNETYFSYLPFISACNYTYPNLYPGQVRIQLLDSVTFYEQLQYKGGLVFWGAAINGYTMMALLPSTISPNYSGYIMYSSDIEHFTRSIILYTLNSTNLTFYYALPTIDIHNTVLSLNITKVTDVQLNNQSEWVLGNCSYVAQDSFAYIGNGSFMFVCGDTAMGFVFAPEDGENATVVDLSGFGVGDYQIATNPSVFNELDPRQQYSWNAVILVTNQTRQNQLYFFTFDFDSNNYSYISFKQMRPQLSLLINRIWGLQVKKQFKRWMDLFSTFNLSQSSNLFPGDVVSVFVSSHDNIFVQYTTKAGANFLCVFDNSGALYWNVTYLGSIVFYGSKAIFIYDKLLDALYFIQVDRPIYTLDVSTVANTTVDQIYRFSIVLECQEHEDLLINYQILWTTPDYPTAYILFKDSTPIYTTDVIYAFELADRFEVIGPDFQLIIGSPPNITVVIIDSSTLTINQTVIGLVDVHVDDNNNMDIVFITNDTVYQVNTRLVRKTLAVQPCGFNTIQSATKTQNDAYIITNNMNQTCLCSDDFSSCSLTTSTAAYQAIVATPYLYGQNSPFYPYLNSMPNNIGIGQYSVKRNLYGLIKQGYIVSILQNNTVYLIDIKKDRIVDECTIECSQYNVTNGEIYIRQFYDPFLILFCERSQQLYQFVIRKQQIVPQRIIPLYRFRTRSGQFSFFPAFSFVFIAVDPVIDIYPMPTNCCVLRLDPCQYTVSVIIQIVQAYSIIAVSNYRNIDVALFRSNSLENSQYIIKAYYPNVWVTINQTSHSSVIGESNITVFFQSQKYNFATYFNLTIIFNLTQINLNLTTNPQQQANIENLNLNFNTTQTQFGTLLVGQSNYSLNQYVCGPVFQSIFYRNTTNMINLQVIQTDVLTKTKKIGNFGIQFIQLINPSKFGVPNLTLNELILAVSVNRMFVFVKVLNNVQLVNISQFQLPQRRCTYYLLNVLNGTAATLTANCEGINYNFRSPLLTINYSPSTTGFTSSYEWVVVPLNLRQIYTIVRGNNQSTLVIGIIQGPMNSATGRLYLCDQQICSPLYVSTADAFLINYAAQLSKDLYIVMSIDYLTIQVFINPQVQNDSSPIPPNYTINYAKFVNQPYCSVLKILNISNTYSYNVLSCSQYYYYVRMDFMAATISVITKFARYSQCSLEDQFAPSALWNDGGLEMLFAECRQNEYILRLQAYETINSSTPIIYKGFLQVFTMTGPQGPNCSNASISPSKIIPLSSSMNYPLFMSYSIKDYNGSVIHKFLYSQISGILIDNIIAIKPSIRVQYKPFLVEYTYPSIQFYAVNQFHHIQQTITTSKNDGRTITFMTYLAFALFNLANIITIICLICFMCQKNNREAIMRMQTRDSTNIGVGEQLQYDDSFRQAFETRQRQATTNLRKNTKRPSQIQMFFVKRK